MADPPMPPEDRRARRAARRARRAWLAAAVAALVVLVASVAVVLSGSPGHTAARATRSAPTTSSLATTTTTAQASTTTAPTTTSTTAAPPSTAAPPTAPPTTAAPATSPPPVGAPPVAGSVTAIGDSIMIDIQPYLEADVPGVRVDGKVSRQFETGIGIVQADRAAGTLGNVLVVELGTNGTVTASEFDAMMQAAAGVKRVVFVNVDVPRSWEQPDNAVLAAGVARYPGVAVLADWYSLSSGHPEWFTPDQVHLNPTGAQALAALIASKV